MRPRDPVFRKLQEFDVQINAKRDQDISGYVRQAHAKAVRSQSGLCELSQWRVIMSSSITKYVSVAVIMCAVLLGIYYSGGSVDLASVAFAEVREAFLAQSWVHIQYDNDTESWHDLRTGNYGSKYLSGGKEAFIYMDYTKNLRRQCSVRTGKKITEFRLTGDPEKHVKPPSEPKSAWDLILGHWEEKAEKESSLPWHVDIKTDTLEDKETIRFDIYHNDVLGNKILTQQIWADPVTKLPIKIKKKLTVQEQRDQKRESVTGVFSFPYTGPGSIYELGVPRDWPVEIEEYDRVANSSIVAILEAGIEQYMKLPKRWRAVVWGDEQDRLSEIEVIWSNGDKVQKTRYRNQSGLGLPVNVDGILSLVNTQTAMPTIIYLYDEDRCYTRFVDNDMPKVRVTKNWFRLPEKPSDITSKYWQPSRPRHIIEKQWEYAVRFFSRDLRFIEDVSNDLKPCVGVRAESGSTRFDYYLDPDRDYICVRHILWKLRNGQWQKDREYINVGMAQLPGGQWYETEYTLISYPKPGSDALKRESHFTVDVQLLKEDEFPPDTFNGEKLLEGAEIETLYRRRSSR